MIELTKKISTLLDPDQALQVWMSSLIDSRQRQNKRETWQPGKPLKLLLACYVGGRNTGSDVRVEEIIRQLRHIIGDENLDLTILTLDPSLTKGYFRGAYQVTLPQIFPPFLSKECPKHHGIVACEGSMFKSKFADALSTMMAGALGIANVENKLSVGYGAEAGDMTPPLKQFVSKQCKKSLVICRNEASRRILEPLGIRTLGGTDTAWTFEPAPLDYGASLLRRNGWDGQRKVLIICPINPFWWPVKPSLVKAATKMVFSEFRKTHYKSIYFHEYSQKQKQKYEKYLDGLAYGITAFQNEREVFPVLVAMERLDRKACEDLSRKLPKPAPIFSSDDYNMYELVSLLRNASLVVSSRFHAIVTSMPAQVPSAGITMDERIRNLLNDRGHQDLCLEAEEKNLGDRLFVILQRLDEKSGEIANDIGRVIPKQLKMMGQMGIDFMDELVRVYPEFPRKNLPRTWDSNLPPLSKELKQLMEIYA